MCGSRHSNSSGSLAHYRIIPISSFMKHFPRRSLSFPSLQPCVGGSICFPFYNELTRWARAMPPRQPLVQFICVGPVSPLDYELLEHPPGPTTCVKSRHLSICTSLRLTKATTALPPPLPQHTQKRHGSMCGCTYVCVRVHVFVCVCARMFVCVCVRVFVCVRVHARVRGGAQSKHIINH